LEKRRLVFFSLLKAIIGVGELKPHFVACHSLFEVKNLLLVELLPVTSAYVLL